MDSLVKIRNILIIFLILEGDKTQYLVGSGYIRGTWLRVWYTRILYHISTTKFKLDITVYSRLQLYILKKCTQGCLLANIWDIYRNNRKNFPWFCLHFKTYAFTYLFFFYVFTRCQDRDSWLSLSTWAPLGRRIHS